MKMWDLSLIFVKQIFVVEGFTFLAKQQASALEYLKKEAVHEEMKRSYTLLRRHM